MPFFLTPFPETSSFSITVDKQSAATAARTVGPTTTAAATAARTAGPATTAAATAAAGPVGTVGNNEYGCAVRLARS